MRGLFVLISVIVICSIYSIMCRKKKKPRTPTFKETQENDNVKNDENQMEVQEKIDVKTNSKVDAKNYNSLERQIFVTIKANPVNNNVIVKNLIQEVDYTIDNQIISKIEAKTYGSLEGQAFITTEENRVVNQLQNNVKNDKEMKVQEVDKTINNEIISNKDAKNYDSLEGQVSITTETNKDANEIKNNLEKYNEMIVQEVDIETNLNIDAKNYDLLEGQVSITTSVNRDANEIKNNMENDNEIKVQGANQEIDTEINSSIDAKNNDSLESQVSVTTEGNRDANQVENNVENDNEIKVQEVDKTTINNEFNSNNDAKNDSLEGQVSLSITTETNRDANEIKNNVEKYNEMKVQGEDQEVDKEINLNIDAKNDDLLEGQSITREANRDANKVENNVENDNEMKIQNEVQEVDKTINNKINSNIDAENYYSLEDEVSTTTEANQVKNNVQNANEMKVDEEVQEIDKTFDNEIISNINAENNDSLEGQVTVEANRDANQVKNNVENNYELKVQEVDKATIDNEINSNNDAKNHVSLEGQVSITTETNRDASEIKNNVEKYNKMKVQGEDQEVDKEINSNIDAKTDDSLEGQVSITTHVNRDANEMENNVENGYELKLQEVDRTTSDNEINSNNEGKNDASMEGQVSITTETNRDANEIKNNVEKYNEMKVQGGDQEVDKEINSNIDAKTDDSLEGQVSITTQVNRDANEIKNNVEKYNEMKVQGENQEIDKEINSNIDAKTDNSLEGQVSITTEANRDANKVKSNVENDNEMGVKKEVQEVDKTINSNIDAENDYSLEDKVSITTEANQVKNNVENANEIKVDDKVQEVDNEINSNINAENNDSLEGQVTIEANRDANQVKNNVENETKVQEVDKTTIHNEINSNIDAKNDNSLESQVCITTEANQVENNAENANEMKVQDQFQEVDETVDKEINSKSDRKDSCMEGQVPIIGGANKCANEVKNNVKNDDENQLKNDGSVEVQECMTAANRSANLEKNNVKNGDVNGLENDDDSLKGQVFIITARFTTSVRALTMTKALVTKGATVILAGPSEVEASEDESSEVESSDGESSEGEAKIRRSTTNGKLILQRLDLSSLESVRSFTKAIKTQYPEFNCIINFASAFMKENSSTEDNVEYHFATNYLGHFFLIEMLKENIRKNHARIVVLTSIKHLEGEIKFENLGKCVPDENQKLIAYNYNNSQLANFYFAQELYRKDFNVHLACDAEEGGLESLEDIIYAALKSENTNIENPATGYMVYNLKKTKSEFNFDQEHSAKLWEESLRMCKRENGENEMKVENGVQKTIDTEINSKVDSKNNDSLEGQVFITFGASKVIGFHTIKELVTKGATVIIGSRNKDKTNEVIAEIRRSTTNGTLHYLPLDLSYLESVRLFAREIETQYPKFNCIINNSCVLVKGNNETVDLIEVHFAKNYLSHFFLIQLLQEHIRKNRARIVMLSSLMHLNGKIDFKNLGKFLPKQKSNACFSNSKLAIFYFARKLYLDGFDVHVVSRGITHNDPVDQFVQSDADVTYAALKDENTESENPATGYMIHNLKKTKSNFEFNEGHSAKLLEGSLKICRQKCPKACM